MPPVPFATSGDPAIWIVDAAPLNQSLVSNKNQMESEPFTCNWSDDMLPWSSIEDPDRGGK
jgi:hypothetical protein